MDKLENYLETNCLTKAIFRRFAVADDIPVNNLIYVNRSTVPTTSVFDEIKETLPVDPKSLKNLQEYTGDEFIQQVLPTVENLEVLIQNNQNNFVSLTAATDKDAPSIFFWGNSIAWAYQDNNADADKQPNVELTQKLDIVKRIIKIRLDEKRAAEEAMQLKQKEKQLLELLHSKQQAKLGELTEDEIKQQLEEIQAGVTA